MPLGKNYLKIFFNKKLKTFKKSKKLLKTAQNLSDPNITPPSAFEAPSTQTKLFYCL